MESFDTWTMVCRRKLRENLAWQKILGHLPEKRRRMCAINKPELAKKALLRCADARSQKGFCHNNEL